MRIIPTKPKRDTIYFVDLTDIPLEERITTIETAMKEYGNLASTVMFYLDSWKQVRAGRVGGKIITAFSFTITTTGMLKTLGWMGSKPTRSGAKWYKEIGYTDAVAVGVVEFNRYTPEVEL